METLLKFLPSTGQPLVVRYGLTTVLVAVFFLFSVAAETTGGQYPFLLTIPIILASSSSIGVAVFSRRLSASLRRSQMDWRPSVVAHLTVLTLFAIISLLLAAFCESLRKALERGAEAQQELQLMLAEQRHRVKNDLSLLSSMISLQARSQSSPPVRAAPGERGRTAARRCAGSRSFPTCGGRSDS